jgi:hypothetical protein
MFEQRAVRSGLRRFGHQVDDIVSEKPAREKVRLIRARPPPLGARQEVLYSWKRFKGSVKLWILREGSHLPSPDV